VVKGNLRVFARDHDHPGRESHDTSDELGLARPCNGVYSSSMAQAAEFEREPVSPQELQPARYFAANFAGEHVAGTEFVIGAMFVAWGVSTSDIIWGLLWGNLMAVLTWGLVCAPIAKDTRLTLYAYLEKIAGPGTVRIYSVVNGILFCVLAGTMITVSTSAVRILFDISPQVRWYPTNPVFVLIALVVGSVVVFVAVRGFKRVAQFAEVSVPWMIMMFFLGALALAPTLVNASADVEKMRSWGEFLAVARSQIWVGGGTDYNIWHVAGIAWVCNLAMHGGLSDMTLLRFARRSSYGFFSVLGMFIGHYAAWMCAGIMGAGAALVLGVAMTELDAGEVAFQSLGAAGIVAVIIAGWTTSNPTIYRAGLAFQSLNPKWSRVRVTAVTGVLTTVIACFPFVFTKLLDFVGLMGLILIPIGAVIFAEHWLLPKLGLTRYWSTYKGLTTNIPAVAAWGVSLVVAFLFNRFMNLHLFFLFIPAWISAVVVYLVLAAQFGARDDYAEKAGWAETAEKERRASEEAYLEKNVFSKTSSAGSGSSRLKIARAGAILSLVVCAVMAVACFLERLELDRFRDLLILPTLSYFVFAIIWMLDKERGDEVAAVT
jgi:cytosine permease